MAAIGPHKRFSLDSRDMSGRIHVEDQFRHTLTQNENLHFSSLNNCHVGMHAVVRFAHAYQDFVADNDYAIFIPIPGLFKGQRLKNVFLTLHVLRNRWFTYSFKTDQKTFGVKYW